jgi:hypothetical protein
MDETAAMNCSFVDCITTAEFLFLHLSDLHHVLLVGMGCWFLISVD